MKAHIKAHFTTNENIMIKLHIKVVNTTTVMRVGLKSSTLVVLLSWPLVIWLYNSVAHVGRLSRLGSLYAEL